VCIEVNMNKVIIKTSKNSVVTQTGLGGLSYIYIIIYSPVANFLIFLQRTTVQGGPKK